MPSYAAAVAQAGIRKGGVVIDVGCGTGRALPPLRQAVGPSGTVVALDVTPEMLSQAGPASLEASATRVLADDAVNRFFAVAERAGGLSRAHPAARHRRALLLIAGRCDC